MAIFIGNSIFGDDAIGLTVGELLRVRLQQLGFDVRILERTGFALLDNLDGQKSTVIVDSHCTSHLPVGNVRICSLHEFKLIKQSTPHYAGIPETLELMENLQIDLPKVWIVGINVQDPYSLSERLSDELQIKVDTIADQVYEKIVEIPT